MLSSHTHPLRPLSCLLALAAAALVGAAAPRPAQAHGDETALSPVSQARLAEARRATARFHDFRQAVAAGYGPAPVVDLAGKACIDDPTKGAMGVHYVNGGLLTARLDEREPQALIYEPQPDGAMRLVGAEYIVFEAVWTGARASNPGLPAVPRLFGQAFHRVPEGNRYGLPAFYALHAWLWQPNPAGPFEDWNPAVRCP